MRNEQILAAARAAQRPTSSRQIASFIRGLRLSEYIAACPATLELYGTRDYVVNAEKLAREWLRVGLGRGFDYGCELLAERLARLQ